MRGLSTAWRTREIRRLVRWMRSYNVDHPSDPVRLVGVDVTDTRRRVYDKVRAYVARAAPHRLRELQRHFAVIRPTRPDHLSWFLTEVEDKQRFWRHAERVRELVRSVTGDDVTRSEAIVRQHARQIAGFYRYYTFLRIDDRDAAMARNVRWLHRRTGDKIAYWAANVHTANAASMRVSVPPETLRWTAAGARLRDYFEGGYVSIGFTFDHGAVNSNWEEPPFEPTAHPVPPVPPSFAEYPLGQVGLDTYLLDLSAPAPPSVRAWLREPTRTRVIGSHYEVDQAANYFLAGGSLGQWFDAVVHQQAVTPTHPLLGAGGSQAQQVPGPSPFADCRPARPARRAATRWGRAKSVEQGG